MKSVNDDVGNKGDSGIDGNSAHADRLPILTYHSLDYSGSVVSCTPQTFAQHLECLARVGWRTVTLAEVVRYRQEHGRWPAKTVVLTFDDGYENFVTEALPILVRHQFTATVFLVSGHMGALNDWARPPARLGSRPLLSWSQVRMLRSQGIELGAHTHRHPDLRSLSEPEIQTELDTCRAAMSEALGVMPDSFAYPYGHVSAVAQRAVAERFASAVTTELRRAGNQTLSCLPRLDSFYLQAGRRLGQAITGRLDGYLAIRRWLRGIRSSIRRGSD